jgi:hypothetical protein
MKVQRRCPVNQARNLGWVVGASLSRVASIGADFSNLG